MGLRLTVARSAALLLTLSEPPVDREALRLQGARDLETYLQSAPADQRAAMEERADLRELVAVLGRGTDTTATEEGPAA
jgi:hypothetical protein